VQRRLWNASVPGLNVESDCVDVAPGECVLVGPVGGEGARSGWRSSPGPGPLDWPVQARVSIARRAAEILQSACEAAGLPPRIVPIPYPWSETRFYEEAPWGNRRKGVQEGITHIILRAICFRWRDIKAYPGAETRRHLASHRWFSAVAKANLPGCACDEIGRAGWRGLISPPSI